MLEELFGSDWRTAGANRHDEIEGRVAGRTDGTDVVDVVPLEEILLGRNPTYIKFDIEGAEHDALLAAKATLRSYMPVLAVSAYHKPEDLWDLPLLIRSICPDYRMYLRRYSDERWETVLYAVPPGRVFLSQA